MFRRTLLIAGMAVFWLLVGGAGGASSADRRAVHFGLTAVVVREDIALFDRWASYLERRIGRPVRFIQRRSYREIMELLQNGELDFAWICGYPYVRRRDPEFLDLLAVPVFEGTPYYQSYTIVHRDSPLNTLDDLEGRVFAFSDPDSNSGYLVPRSMIAPRLSSPSDTFFRLSFFTYSHGDTVEAVAKGVAEAGAVDSYVWEFLRRIKHPSALETRVIHRSPRYGFPPLVARRGVDMLVYDRMAEALMGMAEDAEGRKLLDHLALDAFEAADPRMFDDIRRLAERIDQRPALLTGP